MDLLSNVYVLIAALVLVVFLIVLLIVLMRRRRSGAGGGKTAQTDGAQAGIEGPPQKATLPQAEGREEGISAVPQDVAESPGAGSQEPGGEWTPLLPKDLPEPFERDASSAVVPEEIETSAPPKTGIPAVDANTAAVTTAAVIPTGAPNAGNEKDVSEPWTTARPESPEPVLPPAAVPAPAAPTVAGPLYDPVSAAIGSLLQSEGELTPTEMRRLDLYKPDRILQVIEERKAQAAGRQRAAHVARLEAIERYALALSSAPLVLGTPSPPIGPPPALSALDAEAGPGDADIGGTEATTADGAPHGPEAPQAEESVAADEAPWEEPSDSDERAEEPPRQLSQAIEADSIIDESLTGEHEPPAVDEDLGLEATISNEPVLDRLPITESEELPIEEVETPVEPLQETELPVEAFATADAVRAELETLQEYEPLNSMEEELVEVESDAPIRHPAPVIGEAWFEAPRPHTRPEPHTREVGPDTDATELESRSETAESHQPDVPERAVAEEATTTGVGTRPSLESLIGERPIRETPPQTERPPLNATDIIALPPKELIHSLPRLDATELEKVFMQAETPEIKKRIIDRLGDLRTPDAFLVLQNCLDDPDPTVQVHALEMADRLLADGS